MGLGMVFVAIGEATPIVDTNVDAARPDACATKTLRHPDFGGGGGAQLDWFAGDFQGERVVVVAGYHFQFGRRTDAQGVEVLEEGAVALEDAHYFGGGAGLEFIERGPATVAAVLRAVDAGLIAVRAGFALA